MLAFCSPGNKKAAPKDGLWKCEKRLGSAPLERAQMDLAWGSGAVLALLVGVLVIGVNYGALVISVWSVRRLPRPWLRWSTGLALFVAFLALQLVTVAAFKGPGCVENLRICFAGAAEDSSEAAAEYP
jgi:hypothetical protein